MAKFSLKKKLLPSAMALGLASGIFCGPAHAIQVAADGMGQVLLSPIYQAMPGQSTLITLINTSTSHAVKVKAVIRSKKHCVEVLDFLIYLTPGDVWRGTIYNKDGQAYLSSNDDSIRNLPNIDSFASIHPVDFPLFGQRLETGNPAVDTDDDINEMGIIEFIGHYSVTDTVNPGVGAPVTIRQGMDKFSLARIFDMGVHEIEARNSTKCPNSAAPPGIAAATCPVRVNDPANLKLRGNIEIVTESGRMAYQMTALDGTVGNYVIGNPSLNIDVSTETAIGDAWGYDASYTPYDNIIEIEQAIATSTAFGSYENGISYQGDNGLSRYTGIQVSFPTKYRHRGDVCHTGAVVLTRLGQYYPPFTLNGDVTFQNTSFDNQENSVKVGSSVSGGDTVLEAMTDCSNMLMSPTLFNYDSGAYHFGLLATRSGTNSCSYAGVPALVQTYKYLADSSGNTEQHMFVPASTK